MPIIGYTETGDEVIYNVQNEIEGQHVTEDIAAKQLLATQPVLVELYEYKNDVTIETRVERRVEKIEPFPQRMQNMIIDYLELGHTNVGMQLTENIFGLGKKPPFSLLLSLVNMILQPKDNFKKKEQQKEHYLHCKRAHAILIDVLSLYGPGIYNPIWNQFKYFQLVSANKAEMEKDDIYSELDTNQLEKYSDFWEFTDKLLNQGTKNLDSKCRRLILDFFVNILHTDLKSKLDKESDVKRSVFSKTIKANTLKFYLKILFKKFPSNDENLLHLSGDLINMFITLCCFEKTDIISIFYQKFQQMDAESCQQLMQVIKYPTFLLQLCDLALADTNVSRVEEQYLNYRNKPHVPLNLNKLLFYVFKTLPNSDTLEAIYRHVCIVSKYCMCVLSTASINQRKQSEETNSALSQDQLELMISVRNEVLDDWEIMLEQLMNGNPTNQDLEVMEEIRWSIKLTRLTLIEYL